MREKRHNFEFPVYVTESLCFKCSFSLAIHYPDKTGVKNRMSQITSFVFQFLTFVELFNKLDKVFILKTTRFIRR